MTLYNPPSGSLDANAPYRGKDAGAGVQGSRVPAPAIENPQREIVNAILAAGLTPTNDDLTQLAQAIRKMARAIAPEPALWHTGIAGGSRTALVVGAVTPAVTQDVEFLAFLLRAPDGAAANATLAIGALTGPIQRNDGTAIQNGDIPAGADFLVTRRAGAWRLAFFGRAEVIVPRDSPTLFVRADGSDSNDGSYNGPGGAFQTIAGALNKGVSQYAFASLTAQLGTPGLYVSPQYIPKAAGVITLLGDLSNPGAYEIAGPGSPGQGALQAASNLNVNGLKLTNTGSQSHTVVATSGAQVALTNVALSAPSGTTGYHAYGSGGRVVFASGCSIAGSAAAALCGEGGEAAINPSTLLAILGNPTFATAFALAINGRVTAFAGASISGGASGQRYLGLDYGILNTNGGGGNFFPGTSAGSVNNAIYK